MLLEQSPFSNLIIRLRRQMELQVQFSMIMIKLQEVNIFSCNSFYYLLFITVELETTSLTLVLALDYLLQILAFFQTTGPTAELPKHDVSLRMEPTSVEGKVSLHAQVFRKTEPSVKV